MNIRRTFNEFSPLNVKNRFMYSFDYNPKTGLLSSNGRTYEFKQIKGYRQSVYRVINGVEYRATYHRLCWLLYYGSFVPYNKQIDHIDLDMSNNKITNLRIANNSNNAYQKKLKRANNTSGFKGVSFTTDYSNGKAFHYWKASISVDRKAMKIGRFKNKYLAAAFYDAANRYYFKDFSHCNFQEEYIPAQSVIDLRKLKRSKLSLLVTVEGKLGELRESLEADNPEPS